MDRCTKWTRAEGSNKDAILHLERWGLQIKLARSLTRIKTAKDEKEQETGGETAGAIKNVFDDLQIEERIVRCHLPAIKNWI